MINSRIVALRVFHSVFSLRRSSLFSFSLSPDFPIRPFVRPSTFPRLLIPVSETIPAVAASPPEPASRRCSAMSRRPEVMKSQTEVRRRPSARTALRAAWLAAFIETYRYICRARGKMGTREESKKKKKNTHASRVHRVVLAFSVNSLVKYRTTYFYYLPYEISPIPSEYASSFFFPLSLGARNGFFHRDAIPILPTQCDMDFFPRPTGLPASTRRGRGTEVGLKKKKKKTPTHAHTFIALHCFRSVDMVFTKSCRYFLFFVKVVMSRQQF